MTPDNNFSIQGQALIAVRTSCDKGEPWFEWRIVEGEEPLDWLPDALEAAAKGIRERINE